MLLITETVPAHPESMPSAVKTLWFVVFAFHQVTPNRLQSLMVNRTWEYVLCKTFHSPLMLCEELSEIIFTYNLELFVDLITFSNIFEFMNGLMIANKILKITDILKI